MTTTFRKFWLSLWGAIVIAFATPAYADNPTTESDIADATNAVEEDIQGETDKHAAERRDKILQEAVEALAQTKDALAALEEERIDDALEALALTTGKLELIVAREPSLALAPTDMTITTHDLYGSTKAIRAAINRAEDAISKGNVQEARQILDGLGSEVVITVVNLPLATYPDAIKAITPLIDDGKIEEAKRGIQTALNTLVLTDHVVPLPILRSEALLERAEELAENDARSEEENEELNNNLVAARNQLEMAQLLGYGEKKDYKPLYTQLDEIGRKIEDGQSGEGIFDKMKASMSNLWESISS